MWPTRQVSLVYTPGPAGQLYGHCGHCELRAGRGRRGDKIDQRWMHVGTACWLAGTGSLFTFFVIIVSGSVWRVWGLTVTSTARSLLPSGTAPSSPRPPPATATVATIPCPHENNCINQEIWWCWESELVPCSQCRQCCPVYLYVKSVVGVSSANPVGGWVTVFDNQAVF